MSIHIPPEISQLLLPSIGGSAIDPKLTNFNTASLPYVLAVQKISSKSINQNRVLVITFPYLHLCDYNGIAKRSIEIPQINAIAIQEKLTEPTFWKSAPHEVFASVLSGVKSFISSETPHEVKQRVLLSVAGTHDMMLELCSDPGDGTTATPLSQLAESIRKLKWLSTGTVIELVRLDGSADIMKFASLKRGPGYRAMQLPFAKMSEVLEPTSPRASVEPHSDEENTVQGQHVDVLAHTAAGTAWGIVLPEDFKQAVTKKEFIHPSLMQSGDAPRSEGPETTLRALMAMVADPSNTDVVRRCTVEQLQVAVVVHHFA